jgi:type I restriction enzyme S subunit
MNPDGDYPVFGANGIIGRYDQFNHENPQLLVTCRGATCGAVNVSLPKSWITGNAMVVRPRSLGLSVRFLEYFFRGACDFSKVITGAAQPQITRQTLAPVKISFPPLPEQQRIVAILDEAFARLATATANAEKNLKNARELFDSYLNSIFENDEGLRKVTLGDVCSISSRLVDPRKPEFLDLPHLGAGNMASRTGELSDIKTAREEGLKSGKFLFDSTMVLYSKIRPYLMKACRPDFDGLCSADVYPLSPDSDQLSRDFLFHLLMSKNFTDFAISGSDRAGMPKVNRDHLFKYRVNLPNIEEQALLANKLDEISNEANRLVAFYERRLIDLADLKQSVLRKAFSDELTSPPSQAIKEAAE